MYDKRLRNVISLFSIWRPEIAVSTSVFPKESNRKIVDHISDINLPYSSIAREYLLSEGIPSDRVVKTGSPMYEVLKQVFASDKCLVYFRESGIGEGQILCRVGPSGREYIERTQLREFG